MSSSRHQIAFAFAGPEVSPAADWCLRWRDRRQSWRHRSEGGFDATDFEVAPIDDRAAKAYVERNHYAGSYVASRLTYGLWDRHGALLGVAVLSVPVQRAVLTLPFPELEPYHESLELGRFVLADQVPANGESWFLARAFRLAARDGIRGVVSFSDPMARRDASGRLVFPGHIGIIYHNIRTLASASIDGPSRSNGRRAPRLSERRPREGSPAFVVVAPRPLRLG